MSAERIAASLRSTEAGIAQSSGNPMRRSRSWKRGSERRGSYQSLIPHHLGTPRALKWWQKSTQFLEPGFVESANELLARPPRTSSFEEIAALDI